MREFRNPDGIHPPVASYSHHVEVAGPGRWLVMAGQIGRRPDGTVPDDAIDQLKVALENVAHNLAGAEMTTADLVKITWYHVGDFDPERRREVVTEWLGGHQPASTLVYVARLAAPEYKVEVDAWAFRAE